VRVAAEADATRLSEFFKRAWRESGPDALGFTGATDKAIKEIASREFLIQRITSPRTRILIAERNRRVLGFASLRTLGREKGELSGIVVLPSESGKGFGTRLVEKAFRVATKLGVKRLVVKTEVFNDRAIGFYQKNGFVKTRKTNEKVGRKKVPVQVLEKRL
jgi:ribosomal protein S18 acetylase RimI-like enzyme